MWKQFKILFMKLFFYTKILLRLNPDPGYFILEPAS